LREGTGDINQAAQISAALVVAARQHVQTCFYARMHEVGLRGVILEKKFQGIFAVDKSDRDTIIALPTSSGDDDRIRCLDLINGGGNSFGQQNPEGSRVHTADKFKFVGFSVHCKKVRLRYPSAIGVIDNKYRSVHSLWLGRQAAQLGQDLVGRLHECNRLSSRCDANAVIRTQNEHGLAPVNARDEKAILAPGF
jgi:hypothetical protein